jgi:O-antigen/teichoic acid export membrane protein
LRSGFFWSAFGAVLISAANFLTSIALARILTKVGFGEYSIVLSTVMTISGVGQLALAYTANKYIAEYRLVNATRTGRVLGFCTILSYLLGILGLLIVLFCANWIATHLLNTPILADGLVKSSGLIFFSILNGFQLGALSALECYKKLTKISVLSIIFSSLIYIVLSKLFGLNGLFIGLSIGGFVSWCLTTFALREELKIHQLKRIFTGCLEELPILTKFALPAAISGLISMPALWIGNAYLVRLPEGLQEMAAFSAANTLRSLVLFFPLILNRVVTSLLNNYKGLKNNDGYYSTFKINLKFSILSSIFVSIIVGLFGINLLNFYGDGFRSGIDILYILLISACIEVVFQAYYQHIQANERMWLSLAVIVVPRDVIMVILSIYFIPLFGGVGLALAQTLAWLIALILVILVAGGANEDMKVKRR